jgi:hypothetical protein
MIQRFFFAAFAPSFPNAVLVFLGRWATVRFSLATLVAPGSVGVPARDGGVSR